VALATVDIPAGGTIVCTDQGYGAVRYAIERRARQCGAGIVTAGVPLDADDDAVVAAVAGAIDDRTAVVVVDQITSPTAMMFPIDRLVALCRDADVPVIVDGAHAPGLIDDPYAARPDFWTGNFHKWPCAPRGTAGLVVGERWRDRSFPPIVSFGDGLPYAERFDDQATVDYAPWLAAPIALDVLTEIDWPGIRAEWADKLDEYRDLVASVPGLQAVPLVSPAPTMRLLELPDGFLTSGPDFKAQRQRAVDEFGLELGFAVWQGRSFLRLSAHAYNQPRDYEILAERLPGLATW
jgi:isopenicillin-N epimerase